MEFDARETLVHPCGLRGLNAALRLGGVYLRYELAG